MAKRVLDRFDRWQANHALRKARTDLFESEERHRLFHLLLLELEGEVPPARFRLCLQTALTQFHKDRNTAHPAEIGKADT